jgi:tetratricopeptide (TPR) repeat protein
MDDKALESLLNAKSNLERTWLITQFFLNTLPAELADAVLRAAVPHWFNPPILAAILDTTEEAGHAIIEKLISFPFVEPFGSLGLTIHDLTRTAILTHLSEEKPEYFRTTAERAYTYFVSFDDPQHSVEQLYHFICLNPQDGLNKFRRQEKIFRDQHNFSAASNLLRNIQELVDLKIASDKIVSTEVERQHYLIASRRLEVAQKANLSDEVQEHLGEAAKTFGFDADLLRNERKLVPHVISPVFERPFLLKKLKEAEDTSDPLKQSMWLGEIATTYWETDNFQEAIIFISQALETGEVYDKALVYRGETYRRMGNYESALADFNRAIELNDKDEWSIASRGQTYKSMKNYESALADFDRAIELDEKYTWAIASRGEIYRLLKNYESALADFDRAIELDEKYSSAIASRGETYRLLENYESALADFDRAIELDEKYSFAIASRGQTYQSLKNYESALADFDRAIELNNKSIWAIVSRGETYRLLENYEAALADFDRAIELDEKNDWAFAKRGETYRLIKNYESALANINQAIELVPENDWYYYQRWLTQYVMNKINRIEDIQKAIEIAGREKENKPLGWQNNLNLAVYYLAFGDKNAGIALFEEAIKANVLSYFYNMAVSDLEEYLSCVVNDPSAVQSIFMLNKHLNRVI